METVFRAFRSSSWDCQGEQTLIGEFATLPEAEKVCADDQANFPGLGYCVESFDGTQSSLIFSLCGEEPAEPSKE